MTASEEKILSIWKEHFQQLLDEEHPTNEEDMDHTEDIDPLEVEKTDILDVELAIGRLKRRNAPGIDNLPSELFKDRGEDLRAKLLDLIQKIWEKERIPEAWNTGIICSILKKGSMYKCGNYRDIALFPVAYKIMTNMLLNRIYP